MTRCHRRRWLRMAFAGLAAGLFVTVAGAWGMAALERHERQIRSFAVHGQHGDVHAVGSVSIRRGNTLCVVMLTDGYGIDLVVAGYRSAAGNDAHAQGGASPGTGPLPYWSSARGPARRAKGQSYSGHIDLAYGLPMRVLMHSHVTAPIGVWEIDRNSAASQVRTPGALSVHPSITLPILPIWPGLLLNTLFYAAIWFALFTGLAALRTARRLRRGLCPVCRYDLRGLPQHACPECGWGKDPSARQAAES
ncbi:MAG: hypothetical protein KIS87_07550 [Phycisphaeraceae bacterium]|nr:hypothetical protein [Phycisphaeraceae bacterium]